MKVLDEEIQEQVEENSEKKPVKKTLNDIAAYRKKRKSRARLMRLLLLLTLVCAFAFVWLNAETIFEPLRGIASKINTTTSDDIGFPVSLPVSATYSFEEFGESFSLLTDTYLYTYAATGKQNFAKRHGYSKPIQVTNDKRILLYDMEAQKFSLYNKTSCIYELEADNKIQYAALSKGDKAAIVTASTHYSNSLYVYDGSGSWRYTHNFVDENVMRVAFNDGETSVFVATLGVSGGEIVTNLYRLDLDNAEGATWKYTFSGGSLPCDIGVFNGMLTLVCDNKVIAVDTTTGKLTGSYEYSGTLISPSISDGSTAILYNDISTNKTMLVALDENAVQTGVLSVAITAAEALACGDSIYLLEGGAVKCYDTALALANEIDFDESYSKLIKLDAEIFMLGYDTIQKETF